MNSPFHIDPSGRPVIVANSGGKTSGLNLFKHLEANGGRLPQNARAVFTNTGWERNETLDFLSEQERRWGVEVVMLEFEWREAATEELREMERRALDADKRLARLRRTATVAFALKNKLPPPGRLFQPYDAESLKSEAVGRAERFRASQWASWKKAELIGLPSYRRVTRATASTDGRPYQDLLEGLLRFREDVKGEPGVLPNGVQRICTGHLKMRPSARFARHTWGVKPSGYECRLGLRADEEERIASAFKAKSREAGVPVFPLDDAGIEKADVAKFWRKQGWGLPLKSHEGNCGGCYMKRREALVDLIRRGLFDTGWWRGWEERTGQQFRANRSYRGLEVAARTELTLIPPDDYDNAITCELGYCTD